MPAGSRSGFYRVDLRDPSCTCADYEKRAQACKHIHAAEFASGRVPMPDAEVDAKDLRPPTYPQSSWPEYHAAQCEEREVVERMLADLCGRIVQPPYKGRGRPPLPTADLVHAMTLKVFTGLSTRRAMTDIRRCDGLAGKPPSHNAIIAAMARPDLTPLLVSMIEASATPLAAIESSFSIDATGFSTSTFARWYDHRFGREQKRHRWLKVHAVVANTSNVVVAVAVTDGDAGDSPELPGLIESASERFDVQRVQADRAYLSFTNLDAIEAVGAVPLIPMKSNSRPDRTPHDAWRRLWHLFEFHRETFLQEYHERSNSESLFSALKRKFGGSVRSKKHSAQVNEILLKILGFNLGAVAKAVRMLGVDPGFGLSSFALQSKPNPSP